MDNLLGKQILDKLTSIDERLARMERSSATLTPSQPKSKIEAKKPTVTPSTERDELYDRAVEMVIKYKWASPSLLARKLNIGEGWANKLIKTMEENGIIEAGEGGKTREVIAQKKDGKLIAGIPNAKRRPGQTSNPLSRFLKSGTRQ
jgi:DNA segregation ATPase FtsK/SpoIIIE-like protein